MIPVILDNRWFQNKDGRFVFQKYVGEIKEQLDEEGRIQISIKNGRWDEVKDIHNKPVVFDNPITPDRIYYHESGNTYATSQS